PFTRRASRNAVGSAPGEERTIRSGAIVVVAMRRALAPSLAAMLTRPGTWKATWNAPTSATLWDSSAFFFATPSNASPAGAGSLTAIERAALALSANGAGAGAAASGRIG